MLTINVASNLLTEIRTVKSGSQIAAGVQREMLVKFAEAIQSMTDEIATHYRVAGYARLCTV